MANVVNSHIKRAVLCLLICFLNLQVLHAADAGSSQNAAGGDSVSDLAFQQLKQKNFPLTPGQIHQFKNLVDAQQKAASAPVGPAPSKSSSAIIPVSLKPGGVEQVIRTAKGKITSIVMTDALGKVWPITSFSLGDPASFNIQWDKTSGTLMVQGLKSYARTNIAIMLKNLPIPVMLSLFTGQNEWDFLDYVRVQGYETNGDAADVKPATAENFLIQVLNGVPPQGSKSLQVSGGDAQVWHYQNYYLVLTSGTLISPQWLSRQDGTGSAHLHAYKIPVTPALLISQNGNLAHLTITESNDNDDSNDDGGLNP